MLSAVINSSQVEMFPYFPAFDEANQSLDYIEGSSDFCLRLRGGEYRANWRLKFSHATAPHRGVNHNSEMGYEPC